MNIALFLEMAADAAPDRIALVCDGTRWTYADLLAGARGALRHPGLSQVKSPGGSAALLQDVVETRTRAAALGAN